MSYECDNDNHNIGCQCPGVPTLIDIIESAEAVLEGVTDGPWERVGYGNIHKSPMGSAPPIGKTYGRANTEFVVWARTGVPELIAEVKRLRRQVKHD